MGARRSENLRLRQENEQLRRQLAARDLVLRHLTERLVQLDAWMAAQMDAARRLVE